MSAERDKETILNDAGKAIGRTSGKALRTTAALSFFLTACSTAITPKNPEATQGTGEIATEVVFPPTEAVLTSTETPTETPTPIPTLEPSPAVEPTLAPEVKVSDITDEVRIFTSTTVIGERRLLPFGVSEHHRLQSKEGLKRYLLSGILLETPYYDGNAFVVYRLGIPDFSQGKFRELYYKYPVGVSKEGELVLGVQYSVRNVIAGFDLLGGVSKRFSLEEAFELYEKSVGRQVVFALDVGPTEKSELEHLESYLDLYGSWVCPRTDALKILINQVHENYKVFTYLLSGNPAYEGEELGMLAGRKFVPWSSADWK